MIYGKQEFSIKRKLKYFFFIALVCWFLISIYVIYQYLLSTSKQTVYKGGTFVEGIFDTTSILPYLNQDKQGYFYQGLLFRNCLSIESTGSSTTFKDDLCHVITKDYKTYYVDILSGNIRSDGVPITLEDVFFTYNDIVTHNLRQIGSLKKYNTIKVSQTQNNKIKVEFPSSSIDNTIFFTNYILPRHIIKNYTLTQYQYDFATNPIYDGCAKVMPQSTDQFSLIFDLASCDDTHLGFYQIKDAISFKDFENSVKIGNSIIEAYEYPIQLSGYIEQKIGTKNLVTLFFNTKSKKTRVRLRRALGGLINYNFYTGDFVNYIQKPDDGLFTTYISTGNNIIEFMQGMTTDDVVSKQSLLDSNIHQLPKIVTITGTNQKFVYFAENIKNMVTVQFDFDKKYDKIAIKYEGGAEYFPKSYNKSKKTTKYNIGIKQGNLKPGINKYIIYGRDKKEKKTIATIDLYNLKGNITNSDIGITQEDQKLIILYYNEPISLFVVEQLKKIFEKYNINNYFVFQSVDTAEELEGKLTMGSYDIVINTINMGFKKDISKLFSTTDPKSNPSQYINDRFVSLLKQYFTAIDSQKGGLLSIINNIYQTDMPFVVLGTAKKSIYIKPSILEKLDLNGVELFDYNRRKIIYTNLHLVENISIDIKNVGSFGDFLKFVFHSVKISKDTKIDKDSQNGTGSLQNNTGNNITETENSNK